MECPPANHAQAAGSGNAAVPLLYQDRRRLDGGMHRGKPRSMLPGIAGYPKIGIRPEPPGNTIGTAILWGALHAGLQRGTSSVSAGTSLTPRSSTQGSVFRKRGARTPAVRRSIETGVRPWQEK